MRVAMLVVLLADREMESLGTSSIRRLADLGVTRVGMFRDGQGVAIALEGWAYDPAGSAEATLDVVAADAKEVRSVCSNLTVPARRPAPGRGFPNPRRSSRAPLGSQPRWAALRPGWRAG